MGGRHPASGHQGRIAGCTTGPRAIGPGHWGLVAPLRRCPPCRSEAQLGQAGMIIGTAPQRPAELAISLFYGHIIDRRLARLHQDIWPERQVLFYVHTATISSTNITLAY